jgi:pSer/pThr/pTyr-binding forkhead associated (FHA) protein
MNDTLALWSMLLLAGKWLLIVLVYAALAVVVAAVRQEARLRLSGEPAASGLPAAPGRLRVLSGIDGIRPGRTYDLRPVTTLGAAADNTIVVADPFVSGYHARLTWDGAGWWVEDLDSSNGTLVDGRPCAPNTRCSLAPGARLALGDLLLELVS